MIKMMIILFINYLKNIRKINNIQIIINMSNLLKVGNIDNIYIYFYLMKD